MPSYLAADSGATHYITNMRLPVYLYGHPVLRRECEPVQGPGQELTDLVNNMFATMYASEGVGLAAPQIGKALSMAVIDGQAVAENYPECDGLKLTLINPEVEILDGEEVSRPEGCLSVPGLSETVKRVEHVRVTWRDAEWQEHTQEFSGFAARIILHETDHLHGVMYVDRISPIRKQLIRNKLNAIQRGDTLPDYPARTAPKARRR